MARNWLDKLPELLQLSFFTLIIQSIFVITLLTLHSPSHPHNLSWLSTVEKTHLTNPLPNYQLQLQPSLLRWHWACNCSHHNFSGDNEFSDLANHMRANTRERKMSRLHPNHGPLVKLSYDAFDRLYYLDKVSRWEKTLTNLYRSNISWCYWCDSTLFGFRFSGLALKLHVFVPGLLDSEIKLLRLAHRLAQHKQKKHPRGQLCWGPSNAQIG